MKRLSELPPALQRIAELHAQGKTQRAIATTLTTEGVPPIGRAKGWNQARVRDALQQLEAGENDQAVHRAPTPAPPQHPPQPSLEEQRLRGQVAERDSQIAALQRENAALLPEIDARNGEIVELKKQRAASQKQIADLQRIDTDMPQLGPKPWVGEGWKAKLLVASLGVALVGAMGTGRMGIDRERAEARRVQAKLRAELAAWQTWHEKLTPERQAKFAKWIEEYNQEQAAEKK